MVGHLSRGCLWACQAHLHVGGHTHYGLGAEYVSPEIAVRTL